MICLIFGTRPEIIKMSPVMKQLKKQGTEHFSIHTNQHFSHNMDEVFFRQLELPQPEYRLKIGQRLKRRKTIISHGPQTGLLLERIEEVLLKEKPKIALVEGDTNTVLAGALAASKLKIKVGHIEAGLRSYDRNMPEEINRIVADHISDLLFCPTEKQRQILLKEGIGPEKIHVTGNTIVDAVMQNSRLAEEKSNILAKLRLKPGQYFLATVHREENVTDKQRLEGILQGFERLHNEHGIPIIYPIHRRAERMIEFHGLKIPQGTRIIKPTGYLDFLQMMKNAQLVLTDSGGVQEETCILKVPCVTLRDNTERPETTECGANTLSGTRPERIAEAAAQMIKKERNWNNPFGDGKAAERIVELAKNA